MKVDEIFTSKDELGESLNSIQEQAKQLQDKLLAVGRPIQEHMKQMSLHRCT